MRFNESKYKPQLVQKRELESMDEYSMSLKERFEHAKKPELKVERKSVSTVMKIFFCIRLAIGIALAALGVVSLIHPELRMCLVNVFLQFFMEINFS